MSEITEAKNKKQLQKEMKEKEKQQKEREKKEKARRKQEEKERKKEEKAKQTQITGVIAADPMLPLKQSSSKLLNRPEAVTVAEPPSQISAFGQPIRIAFSTENAGQGSLSAYCKGARVGDVMTELVEKSKGLYCVQFTPIEADIYTLNVQWGGIEVSGSPFQINLSRFSLAPEEVVALEEKEEGVVELSEGAKQNELINQENEEENEKTQQMKSFEGTKLTNREKEEEEIDAKTPQTESSEGAKQSELIDQEKEELDAKTQQVEDDESFNVSGDPFDLAYNASRLLGKLQLYILKE